MKLIKVKSTLKLTDLDSLYKELYVSIVCKETVDIQIPKKMNKYFFSIVPGLIQFFSTWIRSMEHGKLIIDIDPNDKKELESFYEQEFVFPILALAWNEVSIENLDKVNLRPILREFQNAFVLNMRNLKGMKGEKLLLTNLDHFGETSGILPYFEKNGMFLNNEKDLEASLKELILNKVLKYHTDSRVRFEGIYSDIIGIIYELMKNTFEWAKNDENSKPFSPNARGLYMRFYKQERPKIIEDYSKVKPIAEYFESPKMDENQINQVYFIEISVFDSGAGFVKKFKKSSSLELTDIEIIKKCLIKNQTSSNGVFKSEKGLGLDRILNILDGKGLLRIKTDKYCLYRNLIKNPYRKTRNDQDIELYDWYTNKNNSFTVKEFASGSSLSILYPLPQSFRRYE